MRSRPLQLLRLSPWLGLCTALTACAGGNTQSPVSEPGTGTSTSTKVLESGAAMLQQKPPIEALNAYLDGFHFYNGNMQAQMEAHHYCSVLNEEVIQCVIYDGNVADAKIMGVEYIISERLFKGLPEGEKALWHSHGHEVKSGQLVAPGIPEVAEHALMNKLATTYGKTWHTWHTDQDKALPLGVPQLMMGFTADGQADPQMVDQRDKRMGIDFRKKRKQRADIPMPAVAPGADAWQQGKVIQIEDPTGAKHHQNHTAPPTSRGQNASSGE
ncbi:OBAP family protein [Pseudomonas matsuisoli]|uniref:DUF1264 domain-containing protein n=1 Tax=Pseudomonas matsuisoli TaxID=1515666 RepID=A0A917Q1X8_9PSED|nr:OBAP family protein [Pseudomonas matsuisoli]GGK05178.1 hypothetical protein GCM10009304_34100 [Pseudomonas matsuisoli]